ncbi:hypothetical protein ACS8BW_12700, partial [Enterococcus italicus]
METSIIILGVSFGGVLVGFPPLTSKTFGMKNSGVNYVSASSRIEQLTPINFEYFRSQTCSGD